MSVKSAKSSKSIKSTYLSKPTKLARYFIDILAVYSSNNEIPIELDVAMTKIQELYSKKHERERPHVKKCILQIWCKDHEPHIIVIKSQGTRKVVESFSVRSMGTPQVGQLSNQSLIFLPVLNKSYKSELFVFHPSNVTAQELVIKLVKLKQIKEIIIRKSISRASPSPPKSEVGEISRQISNNLDQTDNGYKKEVNDHNETRSDYSMSSTFLNNWFSKVENMVNTSPSSLYQGSGYSQSINGGPHDDLSLLNHYLKEIRTFMNKLYIIMNSTVNDMKTHNGDHQQLIKLPPKSNFIDIVQKIRSSLNIAAANEIMIENPPATDIVNQLLLILRIIGDATKDKSSSQADLLLMIKEPYITSSTATYLTNNLNASNKTFWMSLGESYGYIENVYPLGLQRTVIDEFQVKKDLLNHNYDQNNNRRNIVKSYEKNLEDADVGNEKNFDRRYERNVIRHSEKNADRNYAMSLARSYERHPSRNDYPYDRELRLKESSDDELYIERNFRKNYTSPPLLYRTTLHQSASTFEDDNIHRSYSPMYDSGRRIPHLPDPGIMMHQRSGRRSPNHNCYIHSSSSAWSDRQCRFIDAVQLRNGRLMKITRDRPAQNKREISVSSNEIVEFMTNHGEMFSARNALGEVGLCPSLIAERVIN